MKYCMRLHGANANLAIFPSFQCGQRVSGVVVVVAAFPPSPVMMCCSLFCFCAAQFYFPFRSVRHHSGQIVFRTFHGKSSQHRLLAAANAKHPISPARNNSICFDLLALSLSLALSARLSLVSLYSTFSR